MFLRLEPQQIAEQWQALRSSIRQNLFGEFSEETLASILKACLEGTMQVWFILEVDKTAPLAVVITSLTQDNLQSRKLCNIYGLYALAEKVPNEAYKKAYSTLKRFAKSQGCQAVTMFTQHKGVAALFQSLDNAEIYIYGEIRV